MFPRLRPSWSPYPVRSYCRRMASRRLVCRAGKHANVAVAAITNNPIEGSLTREACGRVMDRDLPRFHDCFSKKPPGQRESSVSFSPPASFLAPRILLFALSSPSVVPAPCVAGRPGSVRILTGANHGLLQARSRHFVERFHAGVHPLCLDAQPVVEIENSRRYIGDAEGSGCHLMVAQVSGVD